LRVFETCGKERITKQITREGEDAVKRGSFVLPDSRRTNRPRQREKSFCHLSGAFLLVHGTVRQSTFLPMNAGKRFFL
jgi:hypothetical protein